MMVDNLIHFFNIIHAPQGMSAVSIHCGCLLPELWLCSDNYYNHSFIIHSKHQLGIDLFPDPEEKKKEASQRSYWSSKLIEGGKYIDT